MGLFPFRELTKLLYLKPLTASNIPVDPNRAHCNNDNTAHALMIEKKVCSIKESNHRPLYHCSPEYHLCSNNVNAGAFCSAGKTLCNSQ